MPFLAVFQQAASTQTHRQPCGRHSYFHVLVTNPCTCLTLYINRSQVDPSVSAQVHYVSAMYYKQMQDFAEFYKSSLLYLAYISSDELPREVKLVRDPLHVVMTGPI